MYIKGFRGEPTLLVRAACYGEARQSVVPTGGSPETDGGKKGSGAPRDGRGPPATMTRLEGRDMSDIPARVKKIVVEHLGVEEEKVTDNASFIDDLGADSLDTVELVMAFEEEFGCEIPDDAAETILTVGDAIKFIQTHAR